MALMTSESDGKRVLPLSRLGKKPKPRSEIKSVSEVSFQSYTVRELESGRIEVERDGVSITPVKPILRQLALELNIPLVNGNGNPLNTRQLGSQMIKTIAELHHADVQQGIEVPPIGLIRA